MKEAKRLNVVECRGTDLQIGHQYGEACRENIRRYVEMGHAMLPQWGGEQLAAVVGQLWPLVEDFDPQVVNFIKGVAEGAGISLEEALVMRAALEFLYYYSQIPGSQPSGMCTSFAVTGAATENSKTILGQNVDFYEGLPVDLLRIKRDDGMEQLCLAIGSCECGLNSAGIGICFNCTLAPREHFKPGIPVGCYLPKAMRQRTVAATLGIFTRAARGIQYYHVGSAGGDIIGIESVFDDFNVMQPDRDVLVHANHYQTERFKKGDWMYQLAAGTYLREQRIGRLIDQNYGRLTPQLMMEFLSDHQNYPGAICAHADETRPRPRTATIASFVMNLEERIMYVACGNPCRYEYLEYKL